MPETSYCAMPATPGVTGAPVNQSYGDIGEIGEPFANSVPSGGVIPGPPVAWSMKTLEPLAFKSKRGAGAGDGDGDGVATVPMGSVASRKRTSTASL
ncbi:MAG: hypothetical protein ABSF08_03905 [Candidatus Cybelea sp.]